MARTLIRISMRHVKSDSDATASLCQIIRALANVTAHYDPNGPPGRFVASSTHGVERAIAESRRVRRMMCTRRARTPARPQRQLEIEARERGRSMFTSRVTLLAVTAIVVVAGSFGRAASQSEVADAVMKGDNAALRA